jgi:putative FmdB family regulatory protein
MPFYEFECKDCSEVFEVRATIKEKEAGLELVCPKCDSHEVRQMLTAASMLRGTNEISPSSCGPNTGPGCCE